MRYFYDILLNVFNDVNVYIPRREKYHCISFKLISTLNKKKKLDGFYFSVISSYLRSPTNRT